MKMQKFLSDFKSTKASNNFLRFLILVLVTVIAVEGAVTLNLMDKQRVIVVPINVDRKFSITGDSASDIEGMLVEDDQQYLTAVCIVCEK